MFLVATIGGLRVAYLCALVTAWKASGLHCRVTVIADAQDSARTPADAYGYEQQAKRPCGVSCSLPSHSPARIYSQEVPKSMISALYAARA